MGQARASRISSPPGTAREAAPQPRAKPIAKPAAELDTPTGARSVDGSHEFQATSEDGSRLYVRAQACTSPNSDGRRSPVTTLFTDGILCDGFIYRYLWDDLSEACNVAHWHFRGHGRSSAPAVRGNIDVEHHAADLNTVRSALAHPEVVLVGHSFGTQVALEAYRQRPERVRALILLCGADGRITYTFKGSDQLALRLPKLAGFVARHPTLTRSLLSRVPGKVATYIARYTGDVDARTLQPADMHAYFEHLSTLDPALMVEMVRLAGEYSAREWLSEVDVPVLVVAGERDTFIPPDVSEEMANQLPGATFCMIPGATHAAPIEHPELLKLRVERFLRDHGIIDSD